MVQRQRLAGDLAGACDHVEHPIGQAAFLADFGQPQQGKRGGFSRFQHHRIARGQCRGNFPRAYHQRKVPRHNGAHHAHGLAVHQAQHIRGGGGNFAIDFIQRLGVIAKTARGRARLGLERHGQFGAIVAHTQNRQL